MNKELAKYILSLPNDVSVRIWLKAFSDMKRNGTANVIKRDVMLEYRISETQFEKYFQPKEAEALGLIKVLITGETFISINFKKKDTPVRLRVPQQKAEIHATVTKNPEPGTTAVTIAEKGKVEQIVVQHKIEYNEYGLIISQIDRHYEMTEKLKRCIIADYCQFFKKLQVQRGLLIGNANVQPVNPKLGDKDVRQLKEIARHFVAIGYNTEPKVIMAFNKMYEQWENLSDRLQKMTSPGGMYTCLNDIILELVDLNNKKHKPKVTPKDEQLISKIDAARRKDNSHLVQAGA